MLNVSIPKPNLMSNMQRELLRDIRLEPRLRGAIAEIRAAATLAGLKIHSGYGLVVGQGGAN